MNRQLLIVLSKIFFIFGCFLCFDAAEVFTVELLL